MSALRVLGLCLALLVMGPALAQDEDENWMIPVTLGKDGWMRYQNWRFGCAIPVPPGMVAERPPDNGDGQSFHTPDLNVGLAVWGSFNVDGFGNVDTRWTEALAEPGRKIAYKRKTKDWYVISGVLDDGTGFYERYTADSKYCAAWRITYPQAEEKRYAPWVERIAKGFEPRLGKGGDTVE